MRTLSQFLRATLLAVMTVPGLATLCAAQGSAAEAYTSEEAWLCKPGRQDLCASGNGITRLSENGTGTVEAWKPNPLAPVDCFYVYPTISEDPGGNSGWVPGPGEKRAVEHQFSLFASVCRPFAPMYRQVTLAGLRSMMSGNPMPIDPALGYADVLAAWRHYLKFENQGRGVVLIGHSQGARMLAQLLQREIEGSPAQSLLVSALLPGFNMDVPSGQDIGGTFKKVPLCKTASQTGCVISYVTFRSTVPPPANTRFGRTKTPGMDVACVDPVALSGSEVKSYLPIRSNLLGVRTAQADWLAMAARTDTPFAALPGLLSAKCVNAEGASYLSVATQPASMAQRPNDFPGDILVNGKALDDWGLHLVDINLVAGNLMDIVQKQSAAYLATASKSK